MITPTNAETILVVDDDDAVREVIDVILSAAGYHVLTAENGREALRLARTTARIDLLSSDLEMPGMRGDELATQFARLHPSAPLLIVSNSEGPITTNEPFEFLPKPFTVARLRGAVRRALQTRPSSSEASPAASALGPATSESP